MKTIRFSSRPTLLLIVLLAALVIIALFADWWIAVPENTVATFVGGQRCAACHHEQTEAWHGSHHDLAMQVANDDTVLGDFDDVTIEHYGVQSKLYRDGPRFLVRTEAPSGELEDFEIQYAFGVYPLQQYLVALDPVPSDRSASAQELSDHADAASGNPPIGNLQVLPLCWDAVQKRWFYLSPPDVDEKLETDDPLHWTNYGQNWNHMCAVCHSTNLEKGFDLETNQYLTTYSDLNVHCESCHGPGSLHVQLAEARSLFWDRKFDRGIVAFTKQPADVQIESCAPCHSRRRPIYPGHVAAAAFHDYYTNSLIEPTLYHADGQIKDEVYVYGSYAQSKMYAEGVRCTECHSPHTMKLKHDGNALCTSCHQHNAAKYDTPAHHRHNVGSSGAQCVECHMPDTVYMDVDWRRDHSMSIPRPQLSLDINVPNACTKCHLGDFIADAPASAASRDDAGRDMSPTYADWIAIANDGDENAVRILAEADQWAAAALQKWYGPQEEDARAKLARALNAAWDGDVRAIDPLVTAALNRKELRPIQRASAISALTRLQAQNPAAHLAIFQIAEKVVRDRDPQLRAAVATALGATSANEAIQQKLGLLCPLLEDPVRVVRFEAAKALAPYPEGALSRKARRTLSQALEEHRTGLNSEADQAAAHMALAILAEQRGERSAAVAAYRNAIRVQPEVLGPRSNLAAILESRGKESAARQLRGEELVLLARDARLAPENVVVQYRYGLNLYLTGDLEQAKTVLRRAHDANPTHADTAYFLALLYHKQGEIESAREIAEDFLTRAPDNAAFQQLQEMLNREENKSRSLPKTTR